MKQVVFLILIYAFALMSISSCGQNMPADINVAIDALPDEIDFNFHVRPILSDRCYSCHGPDEQSRQADLRLDLEEETLTKLVSGNGSAIIKGRPEQSELIKRILTDDSELIMPTPESNLHLTTEEKAILYKWIDQGAEWKEHWAFLPTVKPDIGPKSIIDGQNEIDFFIDQRLSEDNIQFAPPADKERQLRRVTMDLTGLPPTISEIDAFLADKSDAAYEKVVDRLLSTKSYAERMTTEWLDVSRYADSHGLHSDGARAMWPWRDWVIDAFESNMPYDQFGIWQLAGDLLPEATREQRLATGFNRNHMMTAEGGAIDEEYRLSYVFDRAETTGTAFLGLTTMCAKCHDHKFDPVSQEDYFEMTAFFNNVREIGMTGKDGEFGPTMSLADDVTLSQMTTLRQEITQLEEQIEDISIGAVEAYISATEPPADPAIAASFELINKRSGDDGYVIDKNKRIRLGTKNELSPGVSGKAIVLQEDYDDFRLNGIPTYEATDSWSVSMWINTNQKDSSRTQTLMGTTGEKNSFWRGWDLYLDGDNKLNVRLVNNSPGNMIHIQAVMPIEVDTWTQVAMTYDGSMSAAGLRLYVNGREQEVHTIYDRLTKSIKTINIKNHQYVYRNVRVGKSNRLYTGENGIYNGLIDETYIYNRHLTGAEIAGIYNKDATDLIEVDEQLLAKHHYLKSKQQLPEAKKLKEKRTAWLEISSSTKEVMVMEEMSTPRKTYVYDRGEYEHPTYTVTADIPDALGDFPEDLPKNRLGLARWIFGESNPLTARVTVNRYWQMIWGNGLVSTPGDFGIQGALPTHPALLDWLAADFKQHGWNVKRLLKQMVMSRTYRSSSKVNQDLLERDPDNVLLARAPTYRLPAEMIRDNALAASGLLVKEQIGGISVKPYQPEGLWIEKTSFSQELMRYKPNHGDSLYRRSMYTFIRRTQPHPAMTIFDQPSREVCTVKRENTNTPLQALVLLNDPQFVEAAKVLAQRMQVEGGDDLQDQLIYAFRLVTGRYPTKGEIAIFERLYEDQLEIYNDSISDSELLLAVGESKLEKQMIHSKTAALTVVASTIINHDEAYTKR